MTEPLSCPRCKGPNHSEATLCANCGAGLKGNPHVSVMLGGADPDAPASGPPAGASVKIAVGCIVVAFLSVIGVCLWFFFGRG